MKVHAKKIKILEVIQSKLLNLYNKNGIHIFDIIYLFLINNYM